jgi:hypothetical protein
MSAPAPFATKVAVAVADDLAVWQRLNVTAFVVSGIAAEDEQVVGEPYRDADGVTYRPMIREPVFVFAADRARLRRSFERALSRDVRLSLFTQGLFATPHDAANRAAVAAVPTAALDLVGFAVRAARRDVDAVVRGLDRHP